MNKFLLIASMAAMAFGGSTSVFAQTDDAESVRAMREELNELKAQNEERALQDKYQKIWKRTKTFTLGMAFSSWEPENCSAFKPNYGFTLGLTNTYYVHKNPIAGFLKIGIDATWMDVTYMNYKAAPEWMDLVGSESDGNGYYDDFIEDNVDNPNLGSHQIDLAMGVGVSATFAPFTKWNNSLNELKGKVYCRFLPTFSAMLISEPDDTRFNYAFVPYITFGAQISWKVLSVFVEGRWGSANYKIGGLNDDEDYYDYDYSDPGIDDFIKFDKISCKNYGVRFGIGLTY